MSIFENEKKQKETVKEAPKENVMETVLDVRFDKKESNGRKASVRISPLNVRSAPDLSGGVIQSLSVGDSVTIVEEKDGWGRLEDGGWILVDYVS